jgi:WD40 repeat protein
MAGFPSIAACRTFAHESSSGCPSTQVNAVAISPNGQLVATGGDDGRVQIWNFDGRTLTKTTTVLTMFTGNGVAFSPDGTRLIYTSHTMVRTYTVAGWVAGTTLLNDGSSNDLVTAAFTPNSQRIVSVDAIGSAGGDVFAHEVGGSALPALMAHIARQPAALAVSKVAASDGSVGVVVGTYDGTVAVLTLGATAFTAPTVLNPSHPDAAVFAVRFSSDGTLVAMGDDYGITRLWAYPVTSTTPVGGDITFAGGDVINDIAFAPSSKYLAVGGAFQVAQLSIYDVATHAEVDRTTPASDINTLVFSPSGAAIIAGLYGCGAVIVCN